MTDLPDDDQPQGEVRSFATFLGQIDDGVLHADLTEAVKEIVGEMRDIAEGFGGKPKGKLTLTLDLKLDSGVVEVTSKVKVDKPPVPRGKSVFWPAGDNTLSRSNLRQADLPLYDVTSAGARDMKSV